MKKNNYNQAKSQIFDRYIDSLFNSCHDQDRIIKEYRQYTKYFRKNYAKYLPTDRNAKILEIGCGMGHFLYFLQKEGYTNALGIDISSQEIQLCKKQGFTAKKSEALSYLSNLKESVDAVIFDDIIYYFSKDDVLEVLKNIRRVLKKGGICFIKTLNMSNPITASNSNFRDFATEINFTEESLKQICQLVGFSKVIVKPLNIYVFYYNPLNYLAWLAEFCLSKLFRILFLLYGRKTTKIFSKDILAICQK